MAIERDLELLDDYLANRLTGGEKEAFEKMLASDPALKSEFQLQSKLIEGIKTARIAELKTMLNNTPVPPASIGQSLLTKVAAWTVVSGLIATGLYFFLNKEDKEAVENENKAIVENNVAPADSQQLETEPSAATPATPAPEDNTATEKPAVETEKQTKKSTKKSTVDSAQKTPATQGAKRPTVFDPTAEDESETNARPDQPQVDNETQATTSSEVKTSRLEVELIDSDKKYNFHYQFKDGRIFLYGSFERNLYEILEFFNHDGKRTAFLYYKDNYYLINEDDDKIKPLVLINNPVLLNKLKASREK